MTATDFLKEYQKLDDYNEILLLLVPENGGGSDLKHPPDWLGDAFRDALHDPSFEATSENILRVSLSHNWAKNNYTRLYKHFDDELKRLLTLDDHFDIGTFKATYLDGLTMKLPEEYGTGNIIVLPQGTAHLPSSIGSAINFLLSDDIKKTIIYGYNDIMGYQESRYLRARRRINTRYYHQKYQETFHTKLLGLQIHSVLRRYANIGVVNQTDIYRTFLPMPAVGSPTWPGHPTEFGHCVSSCVILFFLLHECSHILLHNGLAETAEIERAHELELEADKNALSIAFRYLPTIRARNAIVLSTMIIFECLRWLECFSQDDPNSHPPPPVRIAQFKRQIEKLYNGSRRELATLKKQIIELEQLFAHLYGMAADLRNPLVLSTTSIETLLDVAFHDRNEDIFKDQILRWFFIGVPRHLCQDLAKARIKFEKIGKDYREPYAKEKLALIMWFYQTANSCGIRKLADAVNHAYQEQLNK